MEKRYIILLTVLMAILMNLHATNSVPDELAQALRARVVEVPDSVLIELDKIEAMKRPALPDFQISLLRGLTYNEKRMFSLVERYAQKVLESDSISSHPKERLNALTLLSVAQYYFGNYQKSIETSLKAIEMARKDGNKASEYNILTTMAKKRLHAFCKYAIQDSQRSLVHFSNFQ